MNGDVTDDRPILVPIDGSTYADSAIPYAARLAGGQRRLALIRVLPDVTDYPILWQRQDESPEAAAHRFQSAAMRSLQVKARSAARAYGVPVDAAVAVGEPAAEILRHARDRDASLIVMASAGLGALDPFAVGSVAERVVRQSGVPVFVVRPGEGTSGAAIQRLVVALDGSRRAMGALPVAADIGRRLDVPIALVTVIDPSRAVPPTEAYEAALAGGFQGEVLAGLQGDAQRTVDEAAAEVDVPGGNLVRFVRYGDVASRVAELCAPGDVLVMATHGRGYERWPLGGVTGMLLRAASVPVLLVRTAPPPELALGHDYESAGRPSAPADPALSGH